MYIHNTLNENILDPNNIKYILYIIMTKIYNYFLYISKYA